MPINIHSYQSITGITYPIHSKFLSIKHILPRINSNPQASTRTWNTGVTEVVPEDINRVGEGCSPECPVLVYGKVI